MSSFVWDNGTLNGSKQNRSSIPIGEDPNKWIQADLDWNPTIQAVYDLRSAILDAVILGLDPQSSTPNPLTAHSSYNLFVRNSDKHLIYNQNGVLVDLAAGGGGGVAIGGAVSGATAGSVLFVNGGGNLAQDNPNFVYDGTSHLLSINNPAAPVAFTADGLSMTSTQPATAIAQNASSPMLSQHGTVWDSTNSRTINTSARLVAAGHPDAGDLCLAQWVVLLDRQKTDHTGTTTSIGLQLNVDGLGNVSVVVPGQIGAGAGVLHFFPPDNTDLVSTGYAAVLSNKSISDKLTFNDSGSAVSAAGHGAIQYHSGHLQFSENGGAWTNFPGPAPSFLSSQQVFSMGTSTTVTTTSSSFSDIGNTATTGFPNYTFNAPANGDYKIQAQVVGIYDQGGTCIIELQVLVDGSPSGSVVWYNNVNGRAGFTINVNAVATMTAGNHTLKVQWRVVDDGGSGVGPKLDGIYAPWTHPLGAITWLLWQ